MLTKTKTQQKNPYTATAEERKLQNSHVEACILCKYSWMTEKQKGLKNYE